MTTTTSPVASRQFLGVTLALLGAAFFATKGIFIKLALEVGIDTLTTLTWRMIVSVPIFLTLGILSYRRRQRAAGAAPAIDRATLFKVMAVGILGY